VSAEDSPLPVELSDEPLVGWRCWFVLPHELLLRPIYKRGLAWKPREALQRSTASAKSYRFTI